MATEKRGSGASLRVTRKFTAPREKVFRAWTDPAALKHWWSPPGFESPALDVDLRPGGAYKFSMRKLPDGEIFHIFGTYKEVKPPEKLVYTWVWTGEPGMGETLVTVEFHDRAGSTEVVLTHEMFTNEKLRDGHRDGWNGCLDRIAAYLA